LALVTIGASAGGIEPLIQLVSSLPRDLHAAVLVVVHVPAQGRSMLPTILARRTGLQVDHAQDGEPLTAGRVYVAPPDRHLLVEDGVVRVALGARENRARPAVDPLFRSAALSHGQQVVAVVLSGAMDDGAAGLADVKAMGGVAVVQDPADAAYSSMPLSAVRSADVDHVAPASEIGALVRRIVAEMTESDQPQEFAARTDPEERLRREVRDAEFTSQPDAAIFAGARPAMFGCPDCGGALWELQAEGILRYRCLVGHGYTIGALMNGQSDGVENALWHAYRALSEQSLLAGRLATRAEDDGHPDAAKRFRRHELETREQADTIRQLIMRRPEPPQTEIPEEPDEQEARAS
jgi:two-component system chemotaxis response regulator CheB